MSEKTKEHKKRKKIADQKAELHEKKPSQTYKEQKRKKEEKEKKLKKLKNYAEVREKEKETLDKLKQRLGPRKYKIKPKMLEQIKENKEKLLDNEEKKELWEKYQKAKKEREKVEEKIPGKVPQIYGKPLIEKRVVPQAAMAGDKKTQEVYGYQKEESEAGLENVKGKNLYKALEDREMKKTIEENMEEVEEQIADILAELTKRGVTHKDIYPGNLIVKEKEGKPKIKLIDFNVSELTSKVTDEHHENIRRDIRRDLVEATESISEILRIEKNDFNRKKFRKKIKEKYKKKIEEKM